MKMQRRLLLLISGFSLTVFNLSIDAFVHADVFVQADGATVGDSVDEGTGQALYGSMGLNAETTGGVYDIYRKYQLPQTFEIQTAENVAGNPSQMKWSNIDQGSTGFTTGFQAPGVFIGKTPSTSSYQDNLINFGEVLDSGDDADPTLSDSNLRRNWDVRFGFLEDPDGFVDAREPNDGTWDLHAGVWGSDGVSFHIQLGADIDEDPITGSTDWFTHPAGGEISFFTQSGDLDTLIGSQDNRDPLEYTMRYVGTGEELEHEANSIGVGYDDDVEVSWFMELNDPNNADAKLGREVKLTVKTGSVLYEGVFDPGSATDEVIPNELNDFDTPYVDGFFDWQNATPVIYMGAENQTAPGAELFHGVFIPGDLNSDGTVDNTDRAIIDTFSGQTNTSYSRGDVDQDGDTDADDLTAWDSLNNPGAQIDAITDLAERIEFVHNVVGTWMGDSNLDLEFNSSDFVAVFQAGLFETGQPAKWATGDWNGDGVFGTSDFVAAFQDGGFELGPRGAVQSVPEPSGVAMIITCGSFLAMIRRRHRR